MTSRAAADEGKTTTTTMCAAIKSRNENSQRTVIETLKTFTDLEMTREQKKVQPSSTT
jgi:hypothetical protein